MRAIRFSGRHSYFFSPGQKQENRNETRALLAPSRISPDCALVCQDTNVFLLLHLAGGETEENSSPTFSRKLSSHHSKGKADERKTPFFLFLPSFFLPSLGYCFPLFLLLHPHSWQGAHGWPCPRHSIWRWRAGSISQASLRNNDEFTANSVVWLETQGFGVWTLYQVFYVDWELKFHVVKHLWQFYWSYLARNVLLFFSHHFLVKWTRMHSFFLGGGRHYEHFNSARFLRKPLVELKTVAEEAAANDPDDVGPRFVANVRKQT